MTTSEVHIFIPISHMRKLRLKRESVRWPRCRSEWQSPGLNPGLSGLALHCTMHSDLNFLFPECIIEEFQTPSVETSSRLPTTVLMPGYHTFFLCCLDIILHFPHGSAAALIRLHTLNSSDSSSECCSVPAACLGALQIPTG